MLEMSPREETRLSYPNVYHCCGTASFRSKARTRNMVEKELRLMPAYYSCDCGCHELNEAHWAYTFGG